jgi:hypothetical protein
MEGSWVGHAAAPRSWFPPDWDLILDLAGGDMLGGHYDAHTAGASPAFYYGSDGPACSALRNWSLSRLDADGYAGTIDVAFDYGPGQCGLPAWQGELSQIVMDATASRLRFSFATSDGYGPVRYDMFRVCPAP